MKLDLIVVDTVTSNLPWQALKRVWNSKFRSPSRLESYTKALTPKQSNRAEPNSKEKRTQNRVRAFQRMEGRGENAGQMLRDVAHLWLLWPRICASSKLWRGDRVEVRESRPQESPMGLANVAATIPQLPLESALLPAFLPPLMRDDAHVVAT